VVSTEVIVENAILRHGLRDPKGLKFILEKSLCEENLSDYIKTFWPVLEPVVKLKWGWVLDAMCEHLEAVTNDEIDNLGMNVPPGLLKPIEISELIGTKRGLIPLGEIVVGDEVLTHKGRYRKVTGVHEQGLLDVVTVNTFNGASVTAAPDHPFLTPDGWVQAGNLKAGMYVGRPHGPSVEGDMPAHEARLMGYLVGDGCVSQPSAGFTNNDRDTLDDFHACARAMGFQTSERKHSNPNCKARYISLYNFPKGGKRRPASEGPVTMWLKKHGLYLKNSYTKSIPDAVMRGGSEAMRNFLGAYWTCDGTISVRHKGKKTSMLASLTTVSRTLAEQTWAICGHLNIDARIRVKRSKAKTKAQPSGDYISYDVVTTRRNEVFKISKLPGLTARKRERASLAFRDVFDPRIYADEVVSVDTEEKKAVCRCLTVEDDHSFVAGGLIVHNSLMSVVFWPTYEWGPRNMPHLRYITTSYKEGLTARDNMKARRLIKSREYKAMFGDRFSLSRTEKDTQNEYHTDATGFRFCVGARGGVTGYRGDRIIIDDPHSVQGAESEAERLATVEWFTNELYNRVNDPETAKRVLIMQRIHEADISGHIQETLSNDWEWLILPMRYEHPEEERSVHVVNGIPEEVVIKGEKRITCLGFQDPRTEEGELLFEDRFPESAVDKLERGMMSFGGEYSVAGQMQQRPSPKGGGMFKVVHIEIVDSVPDNLLQCRGWDFAGSIKKTSPYTAGVKGGLGVNDTLYITDCHRMRKKIYDAETEVVAVVKIDGAGVRQSMPQDPGQAGKSQVDKISRLMTGYNYVFSPEQGSKEDRALPLAAHCNVGHIKILRAPWNKAYLAEFKTFPRGKFMDQVDATSRMFNELLKMPRLMTGGAGFDIELIDHKLPPEHPLPRGPLETRLPDNKPEDDDPTSKLTF